MFKTCNNKQIKKKQNSFGCMFSGAFVRLMRLQHKINKNIKK